MPRKAAKKKHKLCRRKPYTFDQPKMTPAQRIQKCGGKKKTSAQKTKKKKYNKAYYLKNKAKLKKARRARLKTMSTRQKNLMKKRGNYLAKLRRSTRKK